MAGHTYFSKSTGEHEPEALSHPAEDRALSFYYHLIDIIRGNDLNLVRALGY
jgi:hypothetical protein